MHQVSPRGRYAPPGRGHCSSSGCRGPQPGNQASEQANDRWSHQLTDSFWHATKQANKQATDGATLRDRCWHANLQAKTHETDGATLIGPSSLDSRSAAKQESDRWSHRLRDRSWHAKKEANKRATDGATLRDRFWHVNLKQTGKQPMEPH